MKKILSFLLFAVMLLGQLPITALAEDDRTYVKAMDLTMETPKAGMTQQERGKTGAALCENCLRRTACHGGGAAFEAYLEW